MNNDTVYLYKVDASAFEITPKDRAEVFRYAGIKDLSVLESDELQKLQNLAKNAITQIQNCMNCRAVYLKTNVKIGEPTQSVDATMEFVASALNADLTIDQKPEIIFANKKIQSVDLAKNLNNCESIFLFAATLGQEVDKLILRATKIDSAKAVFLQAAGAMFIEKFCDNLEEHLKAIASSEQKTLCPRFSPGYGDVSLEVQKHFFELLQCEKNLSLTLNDCLLMLPEKSVTAFIGIKGKI